MSRRAWLAVGATLGGFVLVGGFAGSAVASTAVLVDEPFTSASLNSPNWTLPSASVNAANDACLTASNDQGATPIPGCSSPGAAVGLQLSTNANDQEGGVGYSSSVPSSLGLDVTFNAYQYDGSAADGIDFYLAASSPTDASASPVTLGPPGGQLGYAPDANAGIAGLTHGYLGVGLDVFGNYSNSAFAGTGCNEDNSATPESVTVRGPGNGTAGYCTLSSQQITSGSLDSANPTAVPVEVAVNPTGHDLQTKSGLVVPAGKYAVVVTPIGQAAFTEFGPLPSAVGTTPDPSWLDSNGVPLQLSFGWSASTGASTDFHTISNAHVETLNGTPPALGVTLSDDSGGFAHPGATVNYSATASVSQADESRKITLTDTFPNQLTPQTAGLGGVGANTTWNCSVNGQTVTCTHPAAAQGTLDAVKMPVVVASAGSQVADTVTVGSPDATQGSATDTQNFPAAPTATTLAFPTAGQPANAQVNAPNPADITVAAETPGGGVDPTYNGTVTLAFSSDTSGNPQFVVGNSTSATLTATAKNGVADFGSPAVNSVGFGDKLQATANGLASATSTAFDVNSAVTTCDSNSSCSATASSPAAGVSAVVQAQPGSGSAVITASYGGNVAPIHPCTGTSATILTFSGNRQKLITLTMNRKLPTLIFCYGQPTPFIDVTLHKTTYFNPVNQDYEGILPPCLPKATGPCVELQTLTFKKSVETIVISSSAADPHVMQ